MPQIRVDSIDDERVAVYRDLPSKQLTRESGLFVVEGRLLVERLLGSSYRTHSILVDERRVNLLPNDLPPMPVLVAAAGLVADILGFDFHRGVLACGYRRPPLSLADVCTNADRSALMVACVNVQDATNLGGVLRNAAAFGVDAVLVGRQCADPFGRRVIRVSMGNAFHLQIVECERIEDDLATLRRDHGFELIATLPAGGTPLASSTKRARTALMIGSEAHGLSDKVLELADRKVTIPMSPHTDSLNAAVACGVCLYHFSCVAESS